MYESPINQILGEMQITYENECMKAVQSCGFDVNKEELTKVLQYDRNQYEKGHNDGYAMAIDEFAEKIMEYCSMSDMNRKMIKQIAEQMKAGGK